MRGTDLPPDRPHPVEEWTNSELIDQYRYVKAEMADDPADRQRDDNPLEVLEEEIARRGLHALADEVEADPSSAGRETTL